MTKQEKEKIKQASDNSLLELSGLVTRLMYEQNRTYAHVGDFMPQEYNNQLLALHKTIESEIEKRDI